MILDAVNDDPRCGKGDLICGKGRKNLSLGAAIFNG